MPARVPVSATIAAQNTFTGVLRVDAGSRVSVSAQPGASTTVTLQRRLDGDPTWYDVDSWSADIEFTYVVDEGCDLRIGVKTGAYGASTTVRLGVG